MHATALVPAEATPATAPFGDCIAFPIGRYAIPAEDTLPHGPWDSLTQAERNRINILLECFRLMEAAPNLRKAAEALEFRFRGIRGFSEGTLVHLFYRWREDGWKALRRGYHVNKSPLPKEFIEFWRALCERNARSMVTAKDKLYAAWFAGDPIPGYGDLLPNGKRGPGTWLDWWHRENPMREAPAVCPGVPDGWSKSTLYQVGPNKIERRLATRGFAAVKPLLPTLVRDTSKLLPLQLLTMDDFECDQLTYAQHPRTKEWQLVKVTGIAVMDVATRRVIALLMKPRFKDEEGTAEAITRAEVRLLFYQVLRDYGVPSCGMTWLVENAAAAITTELQLTTRNLFGGRVQVVRTGLIHDKVFANGFIERGGKPQQKGWIESRFNLVHNVAGDLPGQKGANYLVKPGDHEAKVQYAEHLLGQGRDDAKLSDAQIARLRMPFKSADELIAFYMSDCFPRIDSRVEHKMNGFELLRRWRRNDQDTWHEWEELSALTPDEQLAVEFFPRELRESSRMRWDRLIGSVKCETIAPHLLAMLLLTPKQAKTRKTGVTFHHNGRGYSFADRRSLALRIPEGTDVLCYFDPARPQCVHVCDMEGRYLTELKSLGVDITDPSAMADAEKQLSELYNSILSGVRNRPLHQAADARMLEDRAHNDAIVAENALPAPSPEKPEPKSPVRAYVAKKMGLTASLARDSFAPPAPASVAAADEILSADADRAAVDEIDVNDLLARRAQAAAKNTHPAASDQDASWV